MNNIKTETKKPIVKDFSSQPYSEDDEKDFDVKTIADERLIDSIPSDDDSEFETDMHNYGDQDDLPESDRIMDCGSRSINRKVCMDK